jgi:hypothetical protein
LAKIAKSVFNDFKKTWTFHCEISRGLEKWETQKPYPWQAAVARALWKFFDRKFFHGNAQGVKVQRVLCGFWKHGTKEFLRMN